MIVSRRLRFDTEQPTQFIDLTSRLQDEIHASGLRAGRLFLQSLHTTLGVVVNENEPLLLADFEAMLDRLAPAGSVYLHDDFERRHGVPADEPANGHAHCRLLLLAPAMTLLVEEGTLVLGRWQSVFAAELDGPRSRELALQLEGDFVPGGRGVLPHHHPGDLVEVELARQLAVDPKPVQLPMRRLVEAGGKRLRPTLVSLTGRLGTGYDPLRTSTLAAAIELIHSATLVHDDYVDESPTRRGRATVAAREGPARAIEVGDYYFAKATRVIAELGSPPVTSTVAQAMEAICRAQIDDVALRGQYPGDRTSYLRVVQGKTAALMSAACVAGAQLAGAGEDVVGSVRRYGELVGIAFQMADDVVDYSAESGKPPGQDIRQRTLSLPLIYATEDREVGPEVRELLAGELSDSEVERVAELVIASGALERVGQEAREMVREAVEELAPVPVDGVRSRLVELAHSAVDRVS
ncbi:MAG TPA: secondary thiamine-phosphate synthase enzyme YjbQ [Candidatus Dormibacteraeota bacterium]